MALTQLQVKSDLAKLQQLLGSKLYSDKYSFIQEALQNSTDAMRKCGKADESFDVNIEYRDNRWYFIIRDYGCSFDSIEEFKRLVGTLLESSKTQNKDSSENQELGKFGIGSIAVAAYNPVWNYKVYKNGKAFEAVLKEIDGQGLFMEVSDYYDTSEADGVFLQVEIIDSLSTFVNKLLEKARYFQNIKFNFCAEVINSTRYDIERDKLTFINQHFKIFKSDDFQYSTLNKNNLIHICLDQYAYDIKWEELGISPIYLPIALRFGLDEFETNPTREVITVKADYKDKILNKLNKVADWFVDRYNELYPEIECKDIKHYSQQIDFRSHRYIKLADQNLDIQRFCYDFSAKKFANSTFKDVSASTLNSFKSFMNRYSYKFYEGVAKVRFGTLSRAVGYINWDENYFIKKSFSRTYQNYFKEVLRNQESRIYRKKPVEFVYSNPQENEVGFIEYMKTFERLQPDTLTEEQIEGIFKTFKDFKILLEEFEKIIPNVEDIVPKDYSNSIPKVQRRKSKIEKGDDEIIIKYPREPQKYIQWKAVWSDSAVKVNKLKKLPALHIYGTESRRKQLEEIFTFTKKVQVVMVTDKIEKVIKDENPQNFIHIDDIKSKFNRLSNYFTALYIKEQMVGYKFLFDDVDLIEKYISKSIATDINNLKTLMSKYNVADKVYDDTIVKEIYELYKAKPELYNQDHFFIFNKVNKIKQNLDFIQLFSNDLRNINSEYTYRQELGKLALRTMKEVCKVKKIRMDWENYNLDKVEDFQPIITKPEEVCEV